MINRYIEIIIPIVGLAVNVIVQILSFRYFVRQSLMRSIIFGFISGLCGVILLAAGIPAGIKSGFWDVMILHVLSYIALGYCYFHFINLGETALRIRIMRELREAPQGLSLDELLARYGTKEIIDRRISRLQRNGQIIAKGNKYYLRSPTMLIMAKSILALRYILLGTFYAD